MNYAQQRPRLILQTDFRRSSIQRQMNRLKFPTVIAITLSFIICSVLLISSLLSAAPQNQQQPLITIHNGAGTRELDLIHELQKAEIIPTVLDEFLPRLTITITWPVPDTSAEYGNTLPVSSTQETPKVKFLDQDPNSSLSNDKPPQQQLTIVMTDPDAPSRSNPSNSQFCHWITTSVPLTPPNAVSDISTQGPQGLEDIIAYRPPGPPAKTGKHRYVFVALAPLNRTTEKLFLRAPEERAKWGFEKERMGVREWAEEMGLGVIGANFIYAQNEEQ